MFYRFLTSSAKRIKAQNLAHFNFINKHTQTSIPNSTFNINYSNSGNEIEMQYNFNVGIKTGFVKCYSEERDKNFHSNPLWRLLSVPPPIKRKKDESEKEELRKAIKAGDLATVKMIIAKNRTLLETKFDGDKTPLLLAAWKGYFEIVKWLIEQGADINVKDISGNTVFLSSAYAGSVPIMNYLITQKRPRTYVKNDADMTALLCASIFGKKSAVKWLLDNDYNKITEKDKYNNTALLLAAFNNNLDESSKLDTVKYLLEEGGANINDCNSVRKYAVMKAIEGDYNKMAEWLITRYGNKIIQQRDNDWKYAIHYATEKNNLPIIKLLVQNGADPNKNALRLNKTPLDIASHCGFLEIVEYFCQECNINFTYSALLSTASRGHAKIVDYFLIKYTSVTNEMTETECYNVIKTSIEQNHIQIATDLIIHWDPFDPKLMLPLIKSVRDKNDEAYNNLLDAYYTTGLCTIIRDRKYEFLGAKNINDLLKIRPNLIKKDHMFELLMAAITADNLGAIKKLLQEACSKNIDISNLTNKYNCYPILHQACKKRNLYIIKTLLDYNLPINTINKSGDAALHIACRNGYNEIIDILVSRYPDFNLVNNKHEIPLTCAVANNHIEIVRKILDKSDYKYKDEAVGDTFMHIAIRSGDAAMVKMLFNIDQHYFTSTFNNNGLLATHLAAKLNQPAILKYFDYVGVDLCDPAEKQHKGKTTLHFAAENSKKEASKVLCKLLESEEIELKDANGRKAIDCTDNNIIKEIIRIRINKPEQEKFAYKKLKSDVSPDFKNLVLQGGGVKGMAYLGALEALQEYGVKLENIENIAGTSAGAITALLLGLGLNLPELHKKLNNLDIKSLLKGEHGLSDKSLKPLKETLQGQFNALNGNLWKMLYSFHNDHGIYDSHPFKKWFEHVIKERLQELEGKNSTDDLTFGELHKIKKKYESQNRKTGLKDIHIVTCNLSTKQPEVFSWQTNPDAVISDVICASMSIPILFKPCKIRTKKGNKKAKYYSQDLYVDGGVVCNYPITIFDDISTGEKNKKTMGLRLIESAPKIANEHNTANSINSHLSYFYNLILLLYSAQEFFYQKENTRTITINTRDISTIDFDLSSRDQEFLAFVGREGVDDYFKRNSHFRTNSSTPLGILTDNEIKQGRPFNIVIAEDIFRLFLSASDKNLASLKKLNLHLNTKGAYKEFKGMTPMHIAAYYGRDIVVSRLMYCGANVNATDMLGRFSIDIAREKGHINVILTILDEKNYRCRDKKELADFLNKSYNQAKIQYEKFNTSKLKDSESRIERALNNFLNYHGLQNYFVQQNTTQQVNSVFLESVPQNKQDNDLNHLISAIQERIVLLKQKHQDAISDSKFTSFFSKGYTHKIKIEVLKELLHELKLHDGSLNTFELSEKVKQKLNQVYTYEWWLEQGSKKFKEEVLEKNVKLKNGI